MNILKKGSTGDDVKKLQEFLGVPADGIFGELTENAVKQWQAKNNLVTDGIVGKKTWNAMFKSIGDGIIFDPIDVHITKSPNREIKYLVIHFTAGSSSKKGKAKQNRDWFLQTAASADFVVDDETMIQVNPDPENYYCWAVGDGKGKNGIYNKDCVSIEICSNLKKGTTHKVPNHAGWYFTEDSLNNAIKLSKMIMEKYDIPLERVIRHFDCSSKCCPGLLKWNTGPIYTTDGKITEEKNNEQEWLNFKNKLI